MPTSRDTLKQYRVRKGALREAWPALTFDQQRAIVTAVIDEITLGAAVRGRRIFDPDRVSISWKA